MNSPFYQLLVARWRSLVRESGAIGWAFAFPAMTCIGLALASSVTDAGAHSAHRFLPGLLALSLMMSCMWGLGWSLIQIRIRNLIKRMVVTPMRRWQFLLSFVVLRLALAVVESLVILGFASLVLDVPLSGSVFAAVAISLLGVASLSTLALWVVARPESVESAIGRLNLVTLSMGFLSGALFPIDTLPDWMARFAQVLPLTALVEALRASLLDGRILLAPIAILLGWALLSLFFAARSFRWS